VRAFDDCHECSNSSCRQHADHLWLHFTRMKKGPHGPPIIVSAGGGLLPFGGREREAIPRDALSGLFRRAGRLTRTGEENGPGPSSRQMRRGLPFYTKTVRI